MSYFRSDTITFEAALADLTNGNVRTRRQAAAALGDVTEPQEREQAATALIAVMESAPLAIRIAAARSLGELGAATALPVLATAIKDNDPHLRQTAVMAIGLLGHPDGFEVLVDAVSAGRPDIRFQAPRSLVELEPQRALAPLLDALGREDDDEVIGALALGLGEIGDPSAADPLAAHLDNPRGETQFEVAYALALLADDRGTDIIADALAKNIHSWDAIEALEMIGTDDAIDALATAVTTPPRRSAQEVTLRAASALIGLAPMHPAAQAARALLLEGLNAWRLHVRAVATSELGRKGGRWALAALSRLRQRRRGFHLRDEIDAALTAIETRTNND